MVKKFLIFAVIVYVIVTSFIVFDLIEEKKSDQEKITRLIHQNNKMNKKMQSLYQQVQELQKFKDGWFENDHPTIQGLHPKQVQDGIRDILVYLGAPKKEIPKWVRLLGLTAQVESHLGYYQRQVRGPARGLFQIEPATEKSIWNDYLKYRKELQVKVQSLKHKGVGNLQNNIAYTTALVYVLYKWRKTDVNNIKNIDDYWRVYKEKFNTKLGKATYKDFLQKTRGCNM